MRSEGLGVVQCSRCYSKRSEVSGLNVVQGAVLFMIQVEKVRGLNERNEALGVVHSDGGKCLRKRIGALVLVLVLLEKVLGSKYCSWC